MASDGIDDTLARIDELVAEEKDLRARATGSGLSDHDRHRLTHLQQRLDQCWDVLRRRRAGAEFGDEPEHVEPRPVSEVESYQQ